MSLSPPVSTPSDARRWLAWYALAGVDACVGETPVDRTALPPPAPPSEPRTAVAPAPQPSLPPLPVPASTAPVSRHSVPSLLMLSPAAATAEARRLAEEANDLADLRKAVEGFDALAISKTATHVVFADGNPNARIMLVGEAPGQQEDLQGIPFCGPSGQLLDKMLDSIGLDRTAVYITNTLFWRPPGNRPPTTEELAICLPFVEKHIALVNPTVLVAVGGSACKALLGSEATIGKLRGTFREYRNDYLAGSVTLTAIFHPSYLLRGPGNKQAAWHDLLKLKHWLAERGDA